MNYEDEIKELMKEVSHLKMLLAFSPEILECGEYRNWELVKKYGEPVNMPKNYEVMWIINTITRTQRTILSRC